MVTEDVRTIPCPHCKGSGTFVVPKFENGTRVIWKTGGWWGNCPAVVLNSTKSRVRIKTDANVRFNGGRPWIAYVTPKNLELAQ